MCVREATSVYLQDLRLRLEAGLVQRVGQHDEDVLQQLEEVGLIELLRDVRPLDLAEQLLAHRQPGLGDVPLVVLEGPYHRVDDQLEVLGRDVQEGLEAVLVDALDQLEEVDPDVRVILKVNRDHGQRALEHRTYTKTNGLSAGRPPRSRSLLVREQQGRRRSRTEDLRHLGCDGLLACVDDAGQQRQHLRVTGVRRVPEIVTEHRVKQRRDERVGDDLPRTVVVQHTQLSPPGQPRCKVQTTLRGAP